MSFFGRSTQFGVEFGTLAGEGSGRLHVMPVLKEVFRGPDGRLQAAHYVDFAEDVIEMGPDGMRAYEELIGNDLVGGAKGKEAEDLYLTPGQIVGVNMIGDLLMSESEAIFEDDVRHHSAGDPEFPAEYGCQPPD